jgi:peptidoglycan hydrolase CwlO-like protein
MERAALVFTRWIGSPGSIAFHTILFGATIGLLVANIFSFDVVILVFNTAVSLEAIYLALFIQMTVNYQAQSLVEVGEDIEEIQEDVGELQEDVEEIGEDVGELQEDVEEISEDADEDEQRDKEHQRTLSDIQRDLRTLMNDIDRLKSEEEKNQGASVSK